MELMTIALEKATTDELTMALRALCAQSSAREGATAVTINGTPVASVALVERDGSVNIDLQI